jgi:hypothetical protein
VAGTRLPSNIHLPFAFINVTSLQRDNYLGQSQFRGEIWLVRVVVALAAILQPGFGTLSDKFSGEDNTTVLHMKNKIMTPSINSNVPRTKIFRNVSIP